MTSSANTCPLELDSGFIEAAAQGLVEDIKRKHDLHRPSAAPLSGAGWMGLLCCNAFNNKMVYISSLARMLERNCTDVALCIDIKNSIFVQIFGFRYAVVAELYVQRVSVFKVADFHGLYPLSKNALCMVSPSGNNITRR